jgi:hypothetical protein
VGPHVCLSFSVSFDLWLYNHIATRTDRATSIYVQNFCISGREKEEAGSKKSCPGVCYAVSPPIVSPRPEKEKETAILLYVTLLLFTMSKRNREQDRDRREGRRREASKDRFSRERKQDRKREIERGRGERNRVVEKRRGER